ncbi:hypothetical protein AD948_13040 [Acetobacter senegalensis]|uniref:Uncharacterized protein n=1 Tax=Acetobacter senegalensis TaxID=446692 RepID=A0A149TXN7_9PROT|nr:hypothetical protein AD948_13040 [Acetobacter senegalensis]
MREMHGARRDMRSERGISLTIAENGAQEAFEKVRWGRVVAAEQQEGAKASCPDFSVRSNINRL